MLADYVIILAITMIVQAIYKGSGHLILTIAKKKRSTKAPLEQVQDSIENCGNRRMLAKHIVTIQTNRKTERAEQKEPNRKSQTLTNKRRDSSNASCQSRRAPAVTTVRTSCYPVTLLTSYRLLPSTPVELNGARYAPQQTDNVHSTRKKSVP